MLSVFMWGINYSVRFLFDFIRFVFTPFMQAIKVLLACLIMI